MAIQATMAYYSHEDLALRLLPSLCPLMVDAEPKVRDQGIVPAHPHYVSTQFLTASSFFRAVFSLLRQCIGKLEKGETHESASEAGAGNTATAAPANFAAPAWVGWAVESATKVLVRRGWGLSIS
jgi:SCY1-like protein 1